MPAAGEGAATDGSWVAPTCAVVERFYGGDLPILDLLTAASPPLDDPSFEAQVADHLRRTPDLVEAWQTYSYDQRATPNPWFEDVRVGFFDVSRGDVRVHPDRASACADFIHRLSAWVLQGRRINGSEDRV